MAAVVERGFLACSRGSGIVCPIPDLTAVLYEAGLRRSEVSGLDVRARR